MKYLLVFAVLGLAWALWRNKHRTPPPPPSSTARTPAQSAPQAMVACAHCGLHLPRAEALEHAHRHYCCAEHRSAGPR
ncbi:MAG: PP0621 family protein [Paenacidovorax caeni]